jgi:3-hydroxybutyrate dehydrogenase
LQSPLARQGSGGGDVVPNNTQGAERMNLNGKRCIITGAASGIGRGIAARFVADGARVAIADLAADAAAAVAAELTACGPGDAMAIAMDVTDEAQVNAGVARVIEAWGGVDVLISNAGVQIVHRIEDFPYDAWRKMLAIHLDGAFLTTKACLPHMYAAGSGVVIYMGSVHSHEASKLKAPAGTAKHGLLGLARVLAREGAEHGVRSNVICPGFVRTPLVERQIPEQARDLGISEEEVVATVMLGQTVDAEFTEISDIAELAWFLAAFPNNALTGQSIVASHGWFMN